MEHIITFINTAVHKVFPGVSSFMSTTPGHIILFVVIIVILLSHRYIFVYPLRHFMKKALYKRRRKPMYRMLFYRLEKIILPFRYLVSVFLLQKAVEVFIDNNSTFDFVFFLLFLTVAIWWIFEIIKFILYGYLSMRAHKHRRVRKELFNLLLNITKIILAIVFMLIALTKLGVDVTGLVTSLGIGGVVLGFSAKDTLTNFFDSIRLVGENAFNLGDWIQTDNVEGFITEIGLVATKIRTFDNAMVTIPNSQLANGYIKNWSKRIIGRRIKFKLKIKYTYDTKEIKRVVAKIRSLLESHKDIVTPKKIGYYIKTNQTYKDSLFESRDTLGVRSTLLVSLDEIDEYSMNILIYTFSVSVKWEEWLDIKQSVLLDVIDIIESSTLELAIPTEQIILQEQKAGQ